MIDSRIEEIVEDVKALQKKTEELLEELDVFKKQQERDSAHALGKYLPIRMYLDGIESDLTHIGMVADKFMVVDYIFRWEIGEASECPTFKESMKYMSNMIRKRVSTFFRLLDIDENEQYRK